MVSVAGIRHLQEYRDDDTRRFPESELSKLKFAIKAIEDDVFLDPDSNGEISFDAAMASRLDSYAPEGKTEHQLWDDSKHSVDLYNPAERIGRDRKDGAKEHLEELDQVFQREGKQNRLWLRRRSGELQYFKKRP